MAAQIGRRMWWSRSTDENSSDSSKILYGRWYHGPLQKLAKQFSGYVFFPIQKWQFPFISATHFAFVVVVDVVVYFFGGEEGGGCM